MSYKDQVNLRLKPDERRRLKELHERTMPYVRFTTFVHQVALLGLAQVERDPGVLLGKADDAKAEGAS